MKYGQFLKVIKYKVPQNSTKMGQLKATAQSKLENY